MSKYKIYKITLKNTEKCYIGYTSNVDRRFKQHCKGTYRESRLSLAIKEYGAGSFNVEILTETHCPFEAQYVLEPYYIGKYQSDIVGYNGALHLARPLFYGSVKKDFMNYFRKRIKTLKEQV